MRTVGLCYKLSLWHQPNHFLAVLCGCIFIVEGEGLRCKWGPLKEDVSVVLTSMSYSVVCACY